MSEIVNLRLARKAKARREAEAAAAQRRAQFGRSKAERAAGSRSAERSERHLDDHKLDSSRKSGA